MNYREEFIFWRLASFFIKEQGYRIIQLFDNQKELWFEKVENKKAPIIRILHQELNWSNAIQRDIEFTAANGESIRKQLGRGELKVINIYISQYPPVDDYEYRLAEPYIEPDGNKTSVRSYIFANGQYETGFQKLSQQLEQHVFFQIENVYSETDIEKLKKSALEHARNKLKTERAVFENGKPFFTYFFIIIQIAVFFWLETHGGSTNIPL